MVDTMIFRNVSILTSSDPFSNAERSSEVGGYSAADSNTIVWHDGSDEDIVDDGECTCEVEANFCSRSRGNLGRRDVLKLLACFQVLVKVMFHLNCCVDYDFLFEFRG
jgi:hypothetical protein